MSVDRNVTVRCTRNKSACSGPTFVTGFDSLLNREARCPVCGETRAVYMIHEDGREIHPTEMCPTCNGPILLNRCRCALLDAECVNGHESHFCSLHKERGRVPGNGHDISASRQPPPPPDCKFPQYYGTTVCTCPDETKP